MTASAKDVAEWCKVFHAQGTENFTSSVTFIKQLSVVAISIITYMKNAFPEDCYTIESFDGVNLKILKNKCTNERAQFLSSALTQAFDALDKKYLHQLALCFYEDECKPENLIEYHIFEYTYNPDGVTMNIHSKNRDSQKKVLKCTFKDIKNQTTWLIKACTVKMQACQSKLPDTADICLRLYYNDDAPEGYQAPGYHFDESSQDHLAALRSETVQLEYVQTPYHKLVASTYVRDCVKDRGIASPSQNTPTLTQPGDLLGSVQRSVSESSELPLRCLCNKYEDIGLYQPSIQDLKITCQYCKTLQHASCFGLLPEQVARLTRHCCSLCADQDPTRDPTDPWLATLTHRKRKCLCIFRRTLEWCTQTDAIEGSAIAARFGIPAMNANKLMKLLESYGIIQLKTGSDLGTPKQINKEALQKQMIKYFQHDIADRLLAKTFASQESKVDSVAGVLSPMEKITLQNTSNLGRVVEKPQTIAMDSEDQTLPQYREAILSAAPNIIEDLPLSGSHSVVKDMEGIGKEN